MKTTANDKSKSLSDLYEQWNRVFDAIALRDWDNEKSEYRREFEGRIEVINNALEKYAGNIRKYFGCNDYVSNSDFVKPVPRKIYIAQ